MTCLTPDIRKFPYYRRMTPSVCAPGLSIGQLPRDKLVLAWPLARRAASMLPLTAWLARMSDLFARGGGVLAAQAEDGLIHGIATWETIENMSAERVLQVDTLVTFELNRRAPVERALGEALHMLADSVHCAAVVLPLAQGARPRERRAPEGSVRLSGWCAEFDQPCSAHL